MAGKPQVTLEFAGDDKKLSKTFDDVGAKAKQMEQSVGRSSGDMASKSKRASGFMHNAFSFAARSMTSNFSQAAIGQVTTFLSGMVTEARDAEKVARSTAQGIETIGASSWTSAEAIGELSESISNKIGLDDELIQQSANLLLTFKNVKNAVGENNNVFDRAVVAAQDLAAKGFGDADSAAKMLGKALNDPIKGITALSRAGVTFSEGQKDQIERMVESGDLLGAQKMIMQELEAQVGGTAEATVSAGDKMAVTWSNFQENLGTAVLPILDSLLGKLMGVVTWAQQNPVIVAAIAGITAGIWLLNAALNANPIVLVITLVAALVAGLMILWTQSAAFRGFFISMWNGIRNTVGGVVNWIKNAFLGVVSFFAGIPERIGNALGRLGGIISGVFKGAANMAIDALNWMIDRLNSLINGVNGVLDVAGLGGMPTIGHVSRLHTGGVVPGMPGEERLMMLQAGEKVTTSGQGGNGGATVTFAGNTDSAFATAFMRLVRTGEIQIQAG